MKNKKGLTSLFLLAGIALLTGCGGESSTTAQGGSASTGGNGSSTTTETIAYQFLGTFTDATVQMMGFEYEILLNLNKDGTVEGSGYNILSMDTSTYTENSGFYDDWIGGSWEEGEDEEGQECIVLETVFGKDAVNIMWKGHQGLVINPFGPVFVYLPSELIDVITKQDAYRKEFGNPGEGGMSFDRNNKQ